MPIPTISQLEEAHRTVRQHEPRDLFYQAARDLAERTRHGDSALSLPEALAVLLTWNRALSTVTGSRPNVILSSSSAC